MKRNKTVHVVLAGIGCASLLVYVLACSTSFSPDDTQVLYPAFDQPSDAVSIAVYDRNTGRSEPVFVAIAPDECVTNRDVLLTRAQWLPDGKHVLVAHEMANDKGLSFVVLPRGVNEPVRQLPCPDIDEPMATLELPFAIVGSQLFLRGNETNLARVDLMTGEVMSRDFTNSICVLSAPDGKSVVGFMERHGNEGGSFGLIDPKTLTFTPVASLTNEFKDGSIPAFDPATRRVACVSDENDSPVLLIQKDGQSVLTRSLARDEGKLASGPFLDFTPDGKSVVTAYRFTPEGQTNAEYGLLEIPLNAGALRWTPLFHAQPGDKEELLYAQASLSHDGKTWAIASSYLYLINESLRPEDCALYFVEVGQAKPKINKVLITPPAHRGKILK